MAKKSSAPKGVSATEAAENGIANPPPQEGTDTTAIQEKGAPNPTPPESEVVQLASESDLRAMRSADLRAYAEGHGIDTTEIRTMGDVLAAIVENGKVAVISQSEPATELPVAATDSAEPATAAPSAPQVAHADPDVAGPAAVDPAGAARADETADPDVVLPGGDKLTGHKLTVYRMLEKGATLSELRDATGWRNPMPVLNVVIAHSERLIDRVPDRDGQRVFKFAAAE